MTGVVVDPEIFEDQEENVRSVLSGCLSVAAAYCVCALRALRVWCPLCSVQCVRERVSECQSQMYA